MFRKHQGNGAIYWVPDAPDTSGLEVIEDDPESSWNLWQSAVAQQAGMSFSEPATPHITEANQPKPAGASRAPKAG